MSGVPLSLVSELVTASLAAWRLAGRIEAADDAAITIAGSKIITIKPTPAEAMFRWQVTIDGRRRMAVSLVAVLRQVREALDPDYASRRVRIAAPSLTLPRLRGREGWGPS